MNRIGIISNLTKDRDGTKTRRVVSEAIDIGLEVLLMPDTYSIIKKGKKVSEEEFYKEIEGILVLGGDGTILQAARQAALYDIPILGINLGNLGFLTDVEFSEMEKSLRALKENSYSIEKRMMLSGSLTRDGDVISNFIALNDIGIVKATFGRIIRIKVSVNKEFVDYYSADGLLISTPTGSTAYSLSAGGPIVIPKMECMLITAICPHSLGARPIVVGGDDIIEVEVVEDNKDVLLSIDGQQGAKLKNGDIINIRKAQNYVKLVLTKAERHFFKLIYKKLKERPVCQYFIEEDIKRDEV